VLILAQRMQEVVDRHALPARPLGSGQVQHAAVNRDILAGRHRVDVSGADPNAVARLGHGHLGALGEQLRGEAFLGRIQVLDHNERQARVGRRQRQQLLDRFKAAGRSANGDDARLIVRLRAGPCRDFAGQGRRCLGEGALAHGRGFLCARLARQRGGGRSLVPFLRDGSAHACTPERSPDSKRGRRLLSKRSASVEPAEAARTGTRDVNFRTRRGLGRAAAGLPYPTKPPRQMMFTRSA
jgi:hypothetical protein